MNLQRLKALLANYDNNEKGYFKRFLSLFSYDRPEVAALRGYINSLESTQLDENQEITMQDFNFHLTLSGMPGLISKTYLAANSASAQIFKIWEMESEWHQAQKTRDEYKVNRLNVVPKMKAKQIFVGADVPVVNYYRLDVFDKLIEESGEIRLAKQDVTGEIVVVDASTLSDLINTDPKNSGEFYADYTMKISPTWRPLPSITPTGETITALKTNANVEIGYSARTNLYYMRNLANEEVEVNVEYNGRSDCRNRINTNQVFPNTDVADQFVRSIRFKPDQEKIALPAPKLSILSALINFLRSFTTGDIPNAYRMNDYEVLNARMDKRVGVCSDRCMLMMMFSERLELDVRVVGNGVHQYIEYLDENKDWMPVCLGGGDAELQIEKKMKISLPSFPEINLNLRSISVHDFARSDALLISTQFDRFRHLPQLDMSANVRLFLSPHDKLMRLFSLYSMKVTQSIDKSNTVAIKLLIAECRNLISLYEKYQENYKNDLPNYTRELQIDIQAIHAELTSLESMLPRVQSF